MLKQSLLFLFICLLAAGAWAQQPELPDSTAESLSGGSVSVRAQLLRGSPCIVVGSFSHASNDESLVWMRLLHNDRSFRNAQVFQMVMLERAPGWVRPLVRSSLRHQTPADWQSHVLLLNADDSVWRKFFSVTDERQPAIFLLNAQGQLLWEGQGRATRLVDRLRAKLP